MCKALRAVEGLLLGYKGIQGGLEELDCIVNQGRQRNGRFSSDEIRGVSGLPCPY
jgi:hypothetical protein